MSGAGFKNSLSAQYKQRQPKDNPSDVGVNALPYA